MAWKKAVSLIDIKQTNKRNGLKTEKYGECGSNIPKIYPDYLKLTFRTQLLT